MNIIEPFATVVVADSYFTMRAFSSNWLALVEEEKEQYLALASAIIRIFASYTPENEDEAIVLSVENIEKYDLAEVLETACFEEALYLVNLGKDPTQTLKVLTLGILSTDGTTFSHDFVADIFCPVVVRFLKDAGFEIAAEATNGDSEQVGLITK